jgi:hypothetical protein
MINDDGTDGDMSGEVNNICCSCGRGVRSWFHGTGMICSKCHDMGYGTGDIFDRPSPEEKDRRRNFVRNKWLDK